MMGIVYHANYLPWLEIGRTNLLKENGLSYSEMEQSGIVGPFTGSKAREVLVDESYLEIIKD